MSHANGWYKVCNVSAAAAGLQCYKHGGLDVFSQQVRPLLLRFAPELDEDRKPVGERVAANRRLQDRVLASLGC
jgi:hypothetical protein